MNDAVSDNRVLKYGVPQGSVLRPTLFNIYVELLVINYSIIPSSFPDLFLYLFQNYHETYIAATLYNTLYNKFSTETDKVHS